MTNNINKLKTISGISMALAFASVALFILSHYGKINIELLNFNSRGYFVFVVSFALTILISAILDIKIQKLEGKNAKWTSYLFEIILVILILAYAAYLYSMPEGYCPIRNFFNNGEFNRIKLN